MVKPSTLFSLILFWHAPIQVSKRQAAADGNKQAEQFHKDRMLEIVKQRAQSFHDHNHRE
jgi:hypothetical protein